MNCIEHEDKNAVAACAQCGVGLCKECEANSIFRNDSKQAFCKKCNYELARENDRLFNSALKSKQTIMYIYIGAVAIGLVFFIVRKIIGCDTPSSVDGMLLFWACGSIANFFDKDSMIRRLLAITSKNIKDTTNSRSIPLFLGGLVGTILAVILGVFIMGILSPVFIVTYFIGINKVKKQIANNNAILSQFQTENSHN